MGGPLRNAERQARYRARRDERLSELDLQARSVVDALSGACERGRCSRLTNHLPDTPQEALAELVDRLAGVRLIVCKLEDVRNRM